MAIGLFDPRTVLRCTSLCLILLYMWLLACNEPISNWAQDGFLYPVTYTKLRRWRLDFILAYDVIKKLTYLIWIGLLIPYMFFVPTGLVILTRMFNVFRMARPRFHTHHNWSYHDMAEQQEYPLFDKRHTEDDIYSLLSAAAVVLVGAHIGFSRSVVSQLLFKKVLDPVKNKESKVCAN